MQGLSLEDIQAARERIKNDIIVTGLSQSKNLTDIAGCDVYFKMESTQRCKVFKFRGAINLARHYEPQSTLVLSSGGSHSQSLALAATICNQKSLIYMPYSTPQAKIDATINYGGDVVTVGDNLSECANILVEEMKNHPEWHRVRPYHDSRYIAGEATLGLEILEQAPDVETIIVPIGGGGLIAGLSTAVKAVKPNVRIVGVCMSSCTAAYNNFKKNLHRKLPFVAPEPISPLTGCIESKEPTPEIMSVINENVDEIVAVTEDQVSLAVALIAERGKIITEGAGAACFAALINKKFNFQPNEKIVAILSGGNIQMSMLARSIERMLFLTNSRIFFKAVLPYGTKYLAAMLHLLVELHVEVVSCLSSPHVEIVANKEGYEVIADIPQDMTVVLLKQEFENHGWGFFQTPVKAIGNHRISRASMSSIAE